ncbi:MAG: hypothetical protein RLY86_57 [Pseudomonadota bacterium]|jgi:lysozyme family protein
MADFAQFLPIVLRNEGGWVDNPHDPGGATNKGVTFHTLKTYATLIGVPPTLDSLRALTDDQAGKIYKVEFWDNVFGDEIQDQNLANMLCDFYINAGHHAIDVFMQTLNHMGSNHTPGGRLTRRVLQSLNFHDQDVLYMQYKAARKNYYQQLVLHHPVLRTFLKGWLARVDSFPNVPVSTPTQAASAN